MRTGKYCFTKKALHNGIYLTLTLTLTLNLVTLRVTVSSNPNPTNPTNSTTKYHCEV